MSERTELEQLVKEKSNLEEQSQRLDEEQKKLNLRAKMLYEKIIQEIKKKNNEKEQAVNQLQTKIGDLEAQLDRLLVSGIANKEKTAKDEDTPDEAASEAFEEDVLDIDESITVAEIPGDVAMDLPQQRKKRKLF